MRKFMLITNRYKDQNLALSREIVTYIQQKGGSGDICVSSVEDDDEKGFELSEIPSDTECIMVLGLTVLSTLMMSISFNNMGAEAFAAQYANSEYQIVLETIAEINAISPLAGVMNCVERAAVFALQIELSVLMFGVVRSQKFWLYPVSILLHAVIGFLAALYQTNVLTSVYLLEVLLVVYAVAVFFLARKVYGELPMEKPRELDHFGRVIKRQ